MWNSWWKSAGDSQNATRTDESAMISEADLADEQSTPKAKSCNPETIVPTFSLTNGDGSHNSDGTVTGAENVTTPSSLPSPPLNGARRASSEMPPPPPPIPRTVAMPPPPLNNLSPGKASLRIPSTGPLPNRGPPATSQQRITTSSTLSPTATIPAKSRGKVLLSPGHSPMDWAALTRSRTDLTGVTTFQRVTPSTLRSMSGRKGKPAWSSWHGKVYNLTPYLPFHPGGEAQLMRAAGRDGEKLFMETHPWVNWESMLGACLVGVLVPEEEEAGQGLEGMD